jgi:hypothetical protein
MSLDVEGTGVVAQTLRSLTNVYRKFTGIRYNVIYDSELGKYISVEPIEHLSDGDFVYFEKHDLTDNQPMEFSESELYYVSDLNLNHRSFKLKNSNNNYITTTFVGEISFVRKLSKSQLDYIYYAEQSIIDDITNTFNSASGYIDEIMDCIYSTNLDQTAGSYPPLIINALYQTGGDQGVSASGDFPELLSDCILYYNQQADVGNTIIDLSSQHNNGTKYAAAGWPKSDV